VRVSRKRKKNIKVNMYMKKKLFSILALTCMAVTGAWADGEATVTYALSQGETFTSGQTVDVKDDAEVVVATITYGESGGADFKAAKSDDTHVSGYTAVTDGNGTNGDKTGGTFYTIVPAYDGTIEVAVILNAGKAFYVLEDGAALSGYDGMKVEAKYYGTYSFAVSAGSSYKVYCAGSKLGFYGFEYTYTPSQAAPGTQPGGGGDGADFALSVVASEHGKVAFKNADGETITTAQEGQTVTVEVTPDEGFVVNEVSGQWYAAVAAARRAGIDLLKDVQLTPVEGQANQWTFTMERANVEISATYKKLLQDAWIEAIADQTYTGEALTPVIVVKDGETTLVEDTDYTVSYSDNTQPGTATVTITAKEGSDYSGEATATFTILTDKSALNTAITDAETYYNSISENYPEIAADLLTAINAAKEVQGNDDATQTEVETATTTLNDAVSTAQAAVQAAEEEAADKTAADAVIDLINAIGTVEYTDDCKAKIDAAREAYDALTDAQQALVTNYDVLTAAEEGYAQLAPTTGVSAVKTVGEADVWYDLNGRRVMQPTKGLFIVNGKKIVLK
jgi:hypothetical protein